jgi:hypothetical protein
MTIEQKWVPFDYQRYLDGDEVFNDLGHKVNQLTRFVDLPDNPGLGDSYCMIGTVGKRIVFSDKNGLYHGKQYLFMKQRTKKLWIAVANDDSGRSHDTSCAYFTKEELLQRSGYRLNIDSFHIVEIEIEA